MEDSPTLKINDWLVSKQNCSSIDPLRHEIKTWGQCPALRILKPPMSAESPSPKVTSQSTEVGHYENFPVASLLCPPALRPAIAAIYHFARTADDIADEGPAGPEERLADLAQYRVDLERALADQAGSQRWPGLFQALANTIRSHSLPGPLLHDLISAFEQDVRHTAAGHVYADTPELLAYCKLSANPVGRLLLHLYGAQDEKLLTQSDHVCSALQLINFWQDISVDLPRHRHYLPNDALEHLGLHRSDFLPDAPVDAKTEARRQQLVASLCADARARMMKGAPLALSIPGRAGWELRLVVQGGLRILDKIEAIQHRTWAQRPTVGKLDLPLMVWRAVRMR
jgi:hydroxysqualene synthase